MNVERLKQRLGSETSKVSVNTDTYLKLNLEGKERLLPPDEINKVVNVGDRFNTERQASTFYRILGTLNPAVSNVLFNLDDNNGLLDLYTWKGYNYEDPITKESRFFNPIYPNVLSQYLKEKDGWFGYFDPDIAKSGFCNFYDMEPKRERFSFIPDINPFHGSANQQPVKNWELTITYPHHVDSGHTMVTGGLLIVEAVQATVATRQMTAIGLACQHNLNIGDTVNITGTNGYDGEFVVVRTGLDNGDLKSYLPPTGTVSGNSRMQRMFGGVASTYYFRIFRKIKTRSSSVVEQDDYETYKLAFSENIYYDSISQFVFNEDIDVGDLTDNLGRPLSELYLTIIKTDSNGLFSSVASGIETPFIAELNTSDTNIYLQNIPAINKIHNGGSLPFPSHTPLESAVSIIDNNGIVGRNDFYGDLVEYNSNEVKETILSDVNHRFNTLNRETSPSITYVTVPENPILGTPSVTITTTLGPRQEGYYYKPHNLIQIREFSSYVEQGDQNTVGIPDYAINLGDGRYVWRDLLDIGFSETNSSPLDYPFVNGCHYMYDNYCFYVRRQDAFDDWNLYYYNFPPDSIGSELPNNFDVNTTDGDDC